MFRKLAWSLVLALPLLALLSCGSPEVDYPENPTPPPGQAPGSSTAAQPGQDG